MSQRMITRVIVVVACGLVLVPQVAGQPASPALVIRNALLIDGTGSPAVEGATIVIQQQRVALVGLGIPIPEGARTIDASGQTVLPGLIDAHVHSRAWAWPLFLQFGVTTVRDVGSDPDFILLQRGREQRGELAAPRIFACGPLLDGVPPVWGTQWRGSVGLSSVDEARAEAQRLLDRQVDCLKVYARLTAPLIRAIVELATIRGVPVAGHVGVVSARDAADRGVGSIEHASGISLPLTLEEQDSLVQFLVGKGTYIVATLLVNENIARLPEIGNAQYPFLSMVPPEEVRAWLDWRNDFRFRQATDEYFSRQKQFVRAKSGFILSLRRAGGWVVAGSDTPNPFVIPGFSLHQELDLLVTAGLTPMEAIVSATSLSAALLRQPDLGTVQPGKLADLVIVQGNPLTDITATRNIRLVVKGGLVVHVRR